MRGRLLLAKFGVLLGSGATFAQLPQIPEPPRFPQPSYPATQPPGTYYPGTQQPPNPLPPLRPMGPVNPGAYTPGSPQPFGSPIQPQNPIAQPQEVPLPQRENKFALNATDVSLKRVSGAWQVWAGQRMLRDFGEREMDARDAVRVYRDLHPTEWVSIGGPKPVVEYALVNGRPTMTLGIPGADEPKRPIAGSNMNGPGGTQGATGAISSSSIHMSGPATTGAGAKLVIPIDLKSVRVEPVRGVWCMRDDDNIHFNFGPSKDDAEQAVAVVRRYGFNRIGIVGAPNPMMTYFFVGPEVAPVKGPLVQAGLQAQIDGLNRVGIPVPGVGYVGEMVHFDPRKVEVRKDGSDWIVVGGTEVIGRYGTGEWAARDAAKLIADGHFNDFCKVGSAGLTFFLVDGKAPTRVPYSVQGRRFDPVTLKVQQIGDRWAVTENGRHLMDCANSNEGETLIRVVKYYGFDQLCHIGPSQKVGVSFLSKVK